MGKDLGGSSVGVSLRCLCYIHYNNNFMYTNTYNK